MALEVKYNEIRSDVIAKLEEYAGELSDNLTTLNGIVSDIPQYAEGDVITAYMNEYESIVQRIYMNLNTGLEQYIAQLNSVCDEFEKLDAEMQAEVNMSKEG